MKNKLVLIILGLIFLAININAIEESKIENVLRLKIEQTIVFIKNKNLSKKEAAQKIYAVLDEIFDYKLMAKISLSRNWKKLSIDEKKVFSKAFENKLKLSYIDKIDLYTNQKIRIERIKKIKKNRIQLYATLVGEKENYKIIYKFHKKSDNNWLIYDVNFIGVSIIQTYRKQFSQYMQHKSIQELIKNF